MMEVHTVDWRAVIAKGMDIVITQPAPIAKFDTEFEGRFRRAHKFALVNSQRVIEETDMWQGGFADANSSNLIGLDELDVDTQAFEFVRDSGSCHPASRSAADNANGSNLPIGHSDGVPLLSIVIIVRPY